MTVPLISRVWCIYTSILWWGSGQPFPNSTSLARNSLRLEVGKENARVPRSGVERRTEPLRSVNSSSDEAIHGVGREAGGCEHTEGLARPSLWEWHENCNGV